MLQLWSLFIPQNQVAIAGVLDSWQDHLNLYLSAFPRGAPGFMWVFHKSNVLFVCVRDDYRKKNYNFLFLLAL
uniref:Uncharacterized protein n=1 Tax=Buteo japonicus TaxID=224669 RepID=A0A8C0BDA8_9AVES